MKYDPDYISNEEGPIELVLNSGPELKISTVGFHFEEVYTSDIGWLLHFVGDPQDVPLNVPLRITEYLYDDEFSFSYIHV